MTNMNQEELTCLIELVEMEHLISLCETNTEFFCNLNLKLKHIRRLKVNEYNDPQWRPRSYTIQTKSTKTQWQKGNDPSSTSTKRSSEST